MAEIYLEKISNKSNDTMATRGTIIIFESKFSSMSVMFLKCSFCLGVSLILLCDTSLISIKYIKISSERLKK